MDKPSKKSEKSLVQPEQDIKQTPSLPSAEYIESVHITPERLWNAVLKNYHQQGGPSEH